MIELPTPYYQDGSCTLYHARCEDILPLLPKVDLVLTDPPYGIKRDKGFEGFEGFEGFGKPIARKRFEDDNWDSERPSREIFSQICFVSVNQMFFGGNFFADMLPRSTHWIFWDKLNTMPTFGDGELIWTSFDRKSVKRVVREWNGLIGKEEHREHPTQKPVGIMVYCLQTYSKQSDLILDPFAGSCTTGVAAKQLGRKSILIEISEKYCEVGAKRLSQEELF